MDGFKLTGVPGEDWAVLREGSAGYLYVAKEKEVVMTMFRFLA